MNGDRDAMLGRIREALRVPAPRHHEQALPANGKIPVRAEFREWLPPVGAMSEEQVTMFARQCEALRAEFRQVADFGGAAARIAELAELHNWQRLALHAGVLNDAIAPLLPASLERMYLASGYDPRLLESCDAALSECEVLVAQTGSVCVTSRSSGGRALSVLPPHHLVIAARSQLVPDLTAAYEFLAEKYGAAYPSFMSFISGPSRTGDIERILVLGAHGPKKLEVLLLP